MSDKRPTYHRRITRPLPRAELAPVSTPNVERCPLCGGSGHVSIDQAIDYRRTRETDPPPAPLSEEA